MSDLDALLKSIPIDDIAQKLGVDDATATAAVQQAVPTLLAGLQAHADTDGPAPDGLEAAADAGDGDAVVKSLFGDQSDQVAHAAAGQAPAGVSSDLMQKLLPLLAPMVIAFVTQKLLGGKGGGAPAAGQAQSGGGAGDALGSILGSALGGGGAGGGLGSILGGMLGGGGGQQGGGAGGALGNILGSILGGKK